MKRKIIALLSFLVLLIMMIPFSVQRRDGGTVDYIAILYRVSDVHYIAPLEDRENGKEFNEGLIIEILGFEVFNNVT